MNDSTDHLNQQASCDTNHNTLTSSTEGRPKRGTGYRTRCRAFTMASSLCPMFVAKDAQQEDGTSSTPRGLPLHQHQQHQQLVLRSTTSEIP